ncbi:MAG TPA: thioredoxin family protein [Candidatus Thermoplasmatota archaeon]|nr:thioredoxin family protein [Candidatus Thermoplasmatota archaeon]
MEARGYKMRPGDSAPSFALPGVDGKTHRLEDYKGARALVIAFWCNHCPYVQAYEKRTIDLARQYKDRGVQFLLINSNEVENYPEDDFPHMVKRAIEKNYPFPYLRDADQKVAEAYGAQCTPHFFLFDTSGYLRYQGRLDDNKDLAEAVKRHYLEDAIKAVLAGRNPTEPESWAIGCSIKWTKTATA